MKLMKPDWVQQLRYDLEYAGDVSTTIQNSEEEDGETRAPECLAGRTTTTDDLPDGQTTLTEDEELSSRVFEDSDGC